MKQNYLLISTIAFVLHGCAAPGGWEESDQPQSAAVASLVDTASTQRNAGEFAEAEATLERALRIEPRNGRLWHQLATVQMELGKFQQAENMALRASRYVGENRRLHTSVWNLIADARQAKGDFTGARNARDQADNY